jgi:predicted O-linked N-acetylglucosamine transferase (SPINDLY family)
MQNQGQALLAQGRFDEALAAFEAELKSNPRELNALFGRANAFKALGRLAEARADFDAVLAERPGAAGALNNRGDTLLALQLPAEALSDFERALAIQPGMAQAHLGKGIALQRLHRLEESLPCFDRATQIWPDLADAYFFSALSRERLGQLVEAVAAYDKSLALEPDGFAAMVNRATVLLRLKRFGDAAAAFAKVETLAPGNGQSLNGMAFAAAHACDWSRWDETAAALAAGLRAGKTEIQPAGLFPYSDDPELMRIAAGNLVADLPRSGPLWRAAPFSSGKIRLAYCSADFHNHATSQLMVEAWEKHDRTRFEVIAFDYGPDDVSVLRARVKKAFDRFHHVEGGSADAIARLMADEGVDIAVDLKGLTDKALTGIFACRPAPVQVNYLGYPGTMGAAFMDYILADAVALPLDQQPFYAEKILHLPDCYQPNDRARVAAAPLSRAQAGLPADGFVFCCFNNNWKITPPIFDIWMRLLKAVPGSVLWLIHDNDEAAGNLIREAAARGVAQSRLIFAPRVDPAMHLSRQRLGDLFLDTLPYNAHTTASDALWLGLPVLTCIGAGFPGRVAASLLTAIGMEELITDNLQDYETLALALANDPARLAALKQKLEANRLTTPLFDSSRFTRNLEAAYEQMRDAFLKTASP